jgi:hypothetical protein
MGSSALHTGTMHCQTSVKLISAGEEHVGLQGALFEPTAQMLCDCYMIFVKAFSISV